jgi:hypothetical protein
MKKICYGLLITICLSCGGGGDESIKYSVTYHAGLWNTSGTVPVDNYDYEPNESVLVLDNEGNLKGTIIADYIKQRFIKWNTQSDGNGTDMLPGDHFTITENVDLYAIYTTGSQVISKIGPAGGWVFYDKGHYSGTPSWRYLEAAPVNKEPAIDLIWQSPQETIGVAAQETAVGTGKTNTDAIVLWLQSNSQNVNRAAIYCDELSYVYETVTYDNWFLPSKDELALM